MASIRMKVLPRYPTDIVGVDGITVTKDGTVVRVGLSEVSGDVVGPPGNVDSLVAVFEGTGTVLRAASQVSIDTGGNVSIGVAPAAQRKVDIKVATTASDGNALRISGYNAAFEINGQTLAHNFFFGISEADHGNAWIGRGANASKNFCAIRIVDVDGAVAVGDIAPQNPSGHGGYPGSLIYGGFNVNTSENMAGGDFTAVFRHYSTTQHGESLFAHVHYTGYHTSPTDPTPINSPLPIIALVGVRGTATTIYPLQTDDFLAVYDARGGDGTIVSDSAGGFTVRAAEVWAVDKHGTYQERFVTQAGSITPVAREWLFDQGGLALGVKADPGPGSLRVAATIETGQTGTYAGGIFFQGLTSGRGKIAVQAVAGAPTLTLPSVTGTFAVNASAPLALDAGTGALTFTGAALTKTDDTNVTLTLGGTPATALGRAASITVGWTGTLAAARGGFGSDVSGSSGVPLFAAGTPTFTSTTGTGNFARATSPSFVTPVLGIPTSVTLTNATGLPISTGVSGLATGIATFLATPTSANLAAAVTDEVGSGSLVFNNTPVLVAPVLGSASATSLTSATIFGGTTAGASLLLKSTSSGSPSADFVELWTNGVAAVHIDALGNLLLNETAPSISQLAGSSFRTMEVLNTASGKIAVGSFQGDVQSFFIMGANGAATDSKRWDFFVSQSGASQSSFKIRLPNDAYGAATDYLTLTRTGTAVGLATFAGDVATKSIRGAAVAFASVPSSPVEGMMVAVTDSTTATWGATITGGGANHVQAYYNGTNWTVSAK